MEYPMTKKKLQNFRANEAPTVLARLRVEAVVNEICGEVERTALKTGSCSVIYPTSKFHTIAIKSKSMYASLCNLGGDYWRDPKTGFAGTLPPVTFLPILSTVLEDLVALFPDSKISVDPLETYILIDWS